MDSEVYADLSLKHQVHAEEKHGELKTRGDRTADTARDGQ